MTYFVLLAAGAVGWVAITGHLTVLNLLLGAAISVLALFPLRERIGARLSLRRAGRIARLARLFAYELFASALRVGWLVLQPGLGGRLRPAIVAFPLTAKSDAEITLLANLITLTPGTLSVDVSEDRRLLYVHALDCADADSLIRDIAEGFERRVIEVFA